MVTFRCYISEDGQDQIRLWFEACTDDLQAGLLAVIEVMEAVPRTQWSESYYKELQDKKSSKCAGLEELILISEEGLHYRIFGFSGPGEDDFTMLYALKKNDDPTYKDTC